MLVTTPSAVRKENISYEIYNLFNIFRRKKTKIIFSIQSMEKHLNYCLITFQEFLNS
jgi:hypothetical protein